MNAVLQDFLLRYQVGSGFIRRFDSENFLEAKQFRDEQNRRWVRFIDLIIFRLERTPSADTIISVMRTYQTAVRDNDDRIFELRSLDDPDPAAVYSAVPLLDDPNPSVDDEADAWAYVGAVFYWLSKIAIGSGNFKLNSQTAVYADPRVIRGMADIATPDLEGARSLIKTAETSKKLVDEAWRNLTVCHAGYEAAIKKTREDLIFKSASRLWKSKALKHTVAYTIGFFVIVAAIAAGPISVIYWKIDLWNILPRNSANGEFTYLAALVVALAFVAFAWIFRMLGRFVMDNLTLAADARQRQMILQTFLTLVGTPEAEMKDGERALILNAIFRPLPGQGVDDPTPSSLIDLMKDAFPKALTR